MLIFIYGRGLKPARDPERQQWLEARFNGQWASQ
jgi:hypothetical protein